MRPSFAVRWLIPRLPAFMALHPDIQPEVVTSTLPPIKPANASTWSSGEVKPIGRPTSSRRCFWTMRIILVAAPSLIQNTAFNSPGDLLKHTLLTGRTRRRDWQDWARHADIAIRRDQPVLKFDHLHLVLQAAVDGLGVALCPTSLLGKDLASGRLISPFPELRLPLTRYYYGVSQDAGRDAQVFIDWMFSRIQQDVVDNDPELSLQ